MADYFIVRDANSRGDVATVWNWKLRDWAWDLDGEYTARDGFAYSDKAYTVRRAAVIKRNSDHNIVGVRVVDKNEFQERRLEQTKAESIMLAELSKSFKFK